MIVKKITYGFVTQLFDTDLNKWVGQEFTVGDISEFEDENGIMFSEDELDEEITPPYLPFDMVNPLEEIK